MKERCSNCKWNKFTRGDSIRHSEFSCGNPDSLEYGSPTAWDDSCDDWEEKENADG